MKLIDDMLKDFVSTAKLPDSEDLRKIMIIWHEFTFLMLQEQESESLSDDVLFEKAKELVIKEQKASSSLLERKFRIGYAQATHLIDRLEKEGIIGKSRGPRYRKVLGK